MARDREEKAPAFVVTDKRKFTLDGESRTDVPVEPEKTETAPPPQQAAPSDQPSEPDAERPAPPSPEEQAEQDASYAERTKFMDAELQKQLEAHGSTRRLKDYEMTFEKFIASLYMSALMQMGMVQDPSGAEPRADLIGSRQTIDTIEILANKTKGNLTSQEDAMLKNCLYELRMAYIELTNQLTQPGGIQKTELRKGPK